MARMGVLRKDLALPPEPPHDPNIVGHVKGEVMLMHDYG
jgi:hypothetical protein